ncbi:hypothetical protein [Arcicella lustrica]|uniref:Uncharacterized protein n=1 Tax=Arcicella lustrica TaxID=2984196 RepID=A0ABU5SEA3_9BACT|nr:hypothetical protein [Arcicella sp. DC25W]MEA5425607.1 hypothetical protein [Arcicella sp. DC25W]
MRKDLEITEKGILIRISKRYKENMSAEYLYESTRGVWKLGNGRYENADYAFAIANGFILEVYKIDSWHPAGTTQYATRDDVYIEGRKEFLGTLAEESIRAKYIGKSVQEYFKQGNSNPINYINI